MPLASVPWFIGGGAEHSAEAARNVAWNATNGATGVTLSGDLRVTATSTPSGAVAIAPGGASIVSTYQGAYQQSYVVRNSTQDTLQVAGNSTGSQLVRYIVVEINDPQYAGAAPSNVANGPYVFFKEVSSLTGAHPRLVLARITYPAYATTVTNAMITDLREVANPKSETHNIIRPIVNADNVGTSWLLRHRLGASGLRGEKWPDQTTGANDFVVSVPPWAVRAQIQWTYGSVRYSGLSQYGGLYLVMGEDTASPIATQDFGYDVNENGGHAYQGTITAADTINIPAAWRGTNKRITLRGFVDTRSDNTGEVQLHGRSSIIVNIQWLEQPYARDGRA